MTISGGPTANRNKKQEEEVNDKNGDANRQK